MSYTAGTAWTNSIESKTADRNVRFVAAFPNDFYATLDYCTSSVKIEDACVSGNSINFGGTCSIKANITFLAVNSWDLYLLAEGNCFYLDISSNSSLGTTSPLLYINNVKIVERHSDDSCDVTIEAFDGFCKTEKEYVPTAGLAPLTIKNIIADIGTQCGIDTDTGSLSSWSNTITVPAIKSSLTYRQQIGYLAGLQGGFAKFSWELGSTLKLAWFSSTTKTITADEQYIDELVSKSDSLTEIKIFETGTKDSIITKPNTTIVGKAIKHENPYMTDAIATAVYSSRISSDNGATPKIQFTPLSVRWRGNPEIVAGDIVKVKNAAGNDITCYIMKKTLVFDGGLSETYECFGESEQSVNFSPSPTDQKLQIQYTALEQAIQTATQAITGKTGGYVKLVDLDGDGYPDNFFAADTNFTEDDISETGQIANYTGNVVRINSVGVGISADGGATYVNAITGAGINANAITTGMLSAAVIDTSEIVVNLEGNVVVSVDVVYAASTSNTVEPETGWQSTVPVLESGQYLWQKTVVTYFDNTTSDNNAICISTVGSAGTTLTLVTEQYYASSSPESLAGGSWADEQPVLTAEKQFVWTRSKMTWSDSSVTYTTPKFATSLWQAYYTASTADSSAYNALQTAGDVEGTLVDLTQVESGVTKIKGGRIVTGSILTASLAAGCITADKIATGVLSAENIVVGDLTNHCRVNALVYDTYGFKLVTTTQINTDPTHITSSWLMPQSWTDEYSLGSWVEFVNNKDSDRKYLFEGEFYNKGSGDVYFCVLRVNADGLENVDCYGGADNVVLSGSGYHKFRKTVTMAAESNGSKIVKFLPYLVFTNTPSATNWFALNNVTFRRATGGDITAGKIQSIDGSSYFDLDNNNFRSGSAEYYTDIAYGIIKQYHAPSGGVIGGITPLVSSTEQYQSVYWNSLVSEGILIAYDNGSGSFPIIACFKEDKILFAKDLAVAGDVSVNNIGVNNINAINIGVTNINATGAIFTESKVEIEDTGGIIRADSDSSDCCMLYNLYGTSGVNISNQASGGGFSSAADFTPSRVDIYHNTYVAGNIYSNGVQVTSIEEAKENIGDTDSALPLLRQSKIYKYKYKDTAQTDTKQSGKEQADTEKDKANSIGFIIGRETPEEVISSDGQHVDMYNMVSVLWKATQEILTRLEYLESERSKS